MRTFFNIKKILFLPLAFSTVLSFSAGCSQQTLPQAIYFGTSFHKSGDGFKAVENIISGYNQHIEELNKSKKKEDKLLPLKIKTYNGYEDFKSEVIRKLEIGAYKDLPSVLLNYPNLVSKIATFGKELKLDTVDNSIYSPLFVAYADVIQGLEAKQNWILTTGMSTEVMAINKPMLGFLVEEFVKLGAKILTKDTAYFEEIVKDSKDDRAYIVKVFGNLTHQPEVLENAKNFIFSKEYFNSLRNLLDFGKSVKQLFPDYKFPVVNLDLASNTLFNLAFGKLGNTFDNFLFRNVPKNSGDNKNQLFDTKNIFDKNSPQYKVLEELFNLLVDASRSKVLRISRQDNDYGTEDFKYHKLVFSVSSTAGYKRFYQKAGKNIETSIQPNEISALSAPRKLDSNQKQQTVYLRGATLFGISHSKQENDSALYFLKWYQNTKKWSFNNGKENVINMTPAQYFNLQANYIAIDKDWLSSPIPQEKKADPFYVAGFENFAQINKGTPDWAVFREPVSVNSEAWKNVINEALRKSLYELNSFSEFLEIIQKNTTNL